MLYNVKIETGDNVLTFNNIEANTKIQAYKKVLKRSGVSGIKQISSTIVEEKI